MSDATKTVRWGILGTAHIATKVGRAIGRAKGAELVAIASRSAEQAESWAAGHEVPRAYGSYDALLDDPTIEAVYIPLPPSLHAKWSIRAAERGKHVLCEKPLAGDAAEAAAMVDACRKYGVQLMDGVMWVHHARTEQMRQRLESGELGRLRRVTAAFTFHWDQIPEDNIRLKRELAGGCLGDLGYYCVRAIWWAFGELPTHVYATARYLRDVEHNLSALLWFREDRLASFDCGFDTGMRKWFEIAGADGSLVCDDFTIPWKEERARFWLHRARGKHSEHLVEGCVQEVRMIERFSAVVRDGKLVDSWPHDALQTMRICSALDQSARSSQVVQLEN